MTKKALSFLILVIVGGCGLFGPNESAEPLEDRWMGTDDRGRLRLDLTRNGSGVTGSFSGHIQVSSAQGVNVHGSVDGRVSDGELDLDLIRSDAENESFTGVFHGGDEKEIIGTWTGQYGEYHLKLEPYEIDKLNGG